MLLRMKRTLLLISVISVFAGLSIAQDDAAYTTAMKAVNASNMPLRTAVTAKDTAAASAEAAKMVTAFDTILAYWKAKGTDDAVKFATTARDSAKTIADAKDADAQATALTTLSGTCMGCHGAHRGGGRGAFTFK
jgi:mono/diheme cytochrome c family protein